MPTHTEHSNSPAVDQRQQVQPGTSHAPAPIPAPASPAAPEAAATGTGTATGTVENPTQNTGSRTPDEDDSPGTAERRLGAGSDDVRSLTSGESEANPSPNPPSSSAAKAHGSSDAGGAGRLQEEHDGGELPPAHPRSLGGGGARSGGGIMYGAGPSAAALQQTEAIGSRVDLALQGPQSPVAGALLIQQLAAAAAAQEQQQAQASHQAAHGHSHAHPHAAKRPRVSDEESEEGGTAAAAEKGAHQARRPAAPGAAAGTAAAPRADAHEAMEEEEEGGEEEGGYTSGGAGGRPNLPKPDGHLPCPRCASDDTKFCYYNNYSLRQPRYYCRSCQRYWTAGGILRNVVPGAGKRKTRMPPLHAHMIKNIEEPASASAGPQLREGPSPRSQAHGQAQGQSQGPMSPERARGQSFRSGAHPSGSHQQPSSSGADGSMMLMGPPPSIMSLQPSAPQQVPWGNVVPTQSVLFGPSSGPGTASLVQSVQRPGGGHAFRPATLGGAGTTSVDGSHEVGQTLSVSVSDMDGTTSLTHASLPQLPGSVAAAQAHALGAMALAQQRSAAANNGGTAGPGSHTHTWQSERTLSDGTLHRPSPHVGPVELPDGWGGMPPPQTAQQQSGQAGGHHGGGGGGQMGQPTQSQSQHQQPSKKQQASSVSNGAGTNSGSASASALTVASGFVPQGFMVASQMQFMAAQHLAAAQQMQLAAQRALAQGGAGGMHAPFHPWNNPGAGMPTMAQYAAAAAAADARGFGGGMSGFFSPWGGQGQLQALSNSTGMFSATGPQPWGLGLGMDGGAGGAGGAASLSQKALSGMGPGQGGASPGAAPPAVDQSPSRQY